MEAVNIANNFDEAFEEDEKESLLLKREEIFQSENGPNLLFRGLIIALPISLLMWGVITWGIINLIFL